MGWILFGIALRNTLALAFSGWVVNARAPGRRVTRIFAFVEQPEVIEEVPAHLGRRRVIKGPAESWLRSRPAVFSLDSRFRSAGYSAPREGRGQPWRPEARRVGPDAEWPRDLEEAWCCAPQKDSRIALLKHSKVVVTPHVASLITPRTAGREVAIDIRRLEGRDCRATSWTSSGGTSGRKTSSAPPSPSMAD